jgi:hypothetical protein
MSSSTLGMHHSLWDSLSVEMSQLLQQVKILKQQSPTLADCQTGGESITNPKQNKTKQKIKKSTTTTTTTVQNPSKLLTAAPSLSGSINLKNNTYVSCICSSECRVLMIDDI